MENPKILTAQGSRILTTYKKGSTEEIDVEKIIKDIEESMPY